MLADIIEEFRQRRIQAAEYLRQVRDIMDKVVTRSDDDTPERLQDTDVPKALYGVLREVIELLAQEGLDSREVCVDAALEIDNIIRDKRIVNWVHNMDVKNQMRTLIEDYLFKLQEEHGFELNFEQIDGLMDQCLDIAKRRYPS